MAWLPGQVRFWDEQTTGPGVTADRNNGYQVSDFWIDETANKAYVCLDSAVGAAVWQELGAGGGGGESDHGDLDGLADDDHSQYHTDDRGDARYSVLGHDHDLVYAALAHDHDDRYYTETEADLAFAVIGHDHDEDYAAADHAHDLAYAALAHDHDEDYAAADHAHDLVYAALAHAHDDAYYTEGEIDTLLGGYSATTHDHDEDYADIDHTHDDDYVSVVAEPTAGNLASLTAGGEIADSTYDPSDFAASGHDHDSDYVSVIAEPTEGNLAELTAGGEIADSGYDPSDFAADDHNHDSDYISVVGTPTAGNFPELTEGGELADSGYAPDDFAEADHDHDPLGECAVLASMSANTENIAVTTEHTVALDTEIFDLGGDYNNTTYTFTAPVGGKYEINFRLRLINIDTAATYYATKIVTSNRNYITYLYGSRFTGDVTAWTLTGSVLADMDENDTCYLTITQIGGSQQTDVSYTSYATTLSIHGKDTALFGTGVTGGNSHDHVGGDGAQIDHGELAGLSDNDHTQYARLSGADFTGNIEIDKSSAPANPSLTVISDAAYRSSVRMADNADCGWQMRKNDSSNNKRFEISYSTDNFANNTALFMISTAGEMTLAGQPAFLAIPSDNQSNIAVSTTVTIIFDTEVFDQGADYNNGTYTFTAPVTGKYLLNYTVRLMAIDSATTNYIINLVTSNRTFTSIECFDKFSADIGAWSKSCSILVDMDANDTAYLTIYQTGGTQQTDVSYISAASRFSGNLVC